MDELIETQTSRINNLAVSFREHQIRDDDDFEKHVDYFHFNPVKHGHVDRVCDWPYSTFHSYLRSGVYPIAWAGSGSEINDVACVE